MNRTALATVALLSLAALPAAGQRKVSAGRAVPSDAQIRVWNPAGSVVVSGWEYDSISVTGTADRDAGRLMLGAHGKGAKIGFEGEGEGEARILVRVPRGSTVWVKTASAEVAVERMTGSIDVYSVTGPIQVTGELRHISVESMGGKVEMQAHAPVLRARTGSGSISLRGAGSDVSLSSVEGGIDVMGARFQRASFETIAGGISFRGEIDRAGSVSFQSHDGPIDVRIPSNARANLLLSTYSGVVYGQHPLVKGLNGPLHGKEIRLVNAGGGAQISIRSYRGNIILAGPVPDRPKATPVADAIIGVKKPAVSRSAGRPQTIPR